MASFAIYSETDFSLNFYNRDSVPAVGSTFEGKVVTKAYTSISASTPAWKSDGNVAKIVSSTVVDTVSPTRCTSWYEGAKLLTFVDLAKLDTSKVTSFNNMFYNCSLLESIDCSNFNTSKATNIRCMFYNCTSLTSIDVSNFDVGLVTNFEYVFYGCIQTNITGFENWNTSNATSMKSMFYKCASVPHFDLSKWNTSKVTDMSWMFNRCAGTVDFTGWDTSKVKTFKGAFSAAYFTYLDLSSFDVSAVTDFNSMFFNSTALKTILVSSNWNESIAEDADTSWMFENCYALMGDISYKDMADVAEDGDYTHMTSTYATTTNGYLTMKYAESDDDTPDEDNPTYNKSYFVLGSTMHELANSMRTILGIPQKIALKNFSKILQKQINAVYSAKLTFKDNIHEMTDDIGRVATLHFVDINMSLQTAGVNRFYIIPTIMKNSVITLTDIINLSDDSEIVCSGDISRLEDGLSFIISGDATIQVVKKNSERQAVMMMARRPVTTQTASSHGSDFDVDDLG